MIRAILDNMGKHVSGDGAWWILGLNAILLIPLIFAFFFFPREMLTATALVVGLALGVFVVMKMVRARRHA
jgi:uncharacterized protein YneF (UPF0154 family)